MGRTRLTAGPIRLYCTGRRRPTATLSDALRYDPGHASRSGFQIAMPSVASESLARKMPTGEIAECELPRSCILGGGARRAQPLPTMTNTQRAPLLRRAVARRPAAEGHHRRERPPALPGLEVLQARRCTRSRTGLSLATSALSRSTSSHPPLLESNSSAEGCRNRSYTVLAIRTILIGFAGPVCNPPRSRARCLMEP